MTEPNSYERRLARDWATGERSDVVGAYAHGLAAGRAERDKCEAANHQRNRALDQLDEARRELADVKIEAGILRQDRDNCEASHRAEVGRLRAKNERLRKRLRYLESPAEKCLTDLYEDEVERLREALAKLEMSASCARDRMRCEDSGNPCNSDCRVIGSLPCCESCRAHQHLSRALLTQASTPTETPE